MAAITELATGFPGYNGVMPFENGMLSEILLQEGYSTFMVGKWHLTPSNQETAAGPYDRWPVGRGFERFYGFLGGDTSQWYPELVYDNHQVEPPGTPEEGYHLTEDITDKAIGFIKDAKAVAPEKPFFLYLAFNAVHTPMQADDPRLMKFAHISDKQRRTYAAMMSAMDDAIGRVRKKLDETGLAQNTLVTFISDNGGPTMPGTTTNASINKPLRGSKRTTLEGGIRVPFLVSFPGHVKPGVYDKPVIQLDLNATALTAAGVGTQPDWKLDGVDLVPFLSGTAAAAPHDTLYWRFGGQMAIRQADYKLVRYDTNADTLTLGLEACNGVGVHGGQ
jgi:arylsulfatase A-like enzyme